MCSPAGSATYGNEGGPQRAFGATSLKTDGKIFAMLVKDRLVVKLPAARVDALVEEGWGSSSTPAMAGSRRSGSRVFGDDPAAWRALATRIRGLRGEAIAMTGTDRGHGGLTPHELQNQASWDADSDAYQARHGEQLAESTGLAWGTYQIPEPELRVLGDVAGKDILELGCGAAQWSIGLAKLGARPVGHRPVGAPARARAAAPGGGRRRRSR